MIGFSQRCGQRLFWVFLLVCLGFSDALFAYVVDDLRVHQGDILKFNISDSFSEEERNVIFQAFDRWNNLLSQYYSNPPILKYEIIADGGTSDRNGTFDCSNTGFKRPRIGPINCFGNDLNEIYKMEMMPL